MMPFKEFQKLTDGHIPPRDLEVAYKREVMRELERYFHLLLGSLEHNKKDITVQQFEDLEVTFRTLLGVETKRFGINYEQENKPAPGGTDPRAKISG